MALIVRGPDWNQETFVAHCERMIPAAQLPSKVVAVRAIPRDQSRRIDRLALAQLAAEATPNARQALSLARQAAEFERLGRWSDALESYRKLYRANPESHEHLPRVGRLLLRLGRANDARRVLDEALARMPNTAEILTDHGIALALLGDVAGAIGQFKAALNQDPSYATAYYNLGRALIERRSFEEAQSVLEKLLQTRPDYADAYCALGEAIYGMGRPYDAIMEYKRAIELAPDHLAATFNMGVAIQDLNRPVEAIEFFKRAIAIDPNFADARRAVGIALQTMGRPLEARSSLEEAAARVPNSGRYVRDIVEIASPDELRGLVGRVDALLAKQAGLSHADRIHLLAAKSIAHDKLGEHDMAFRFAQQANELAYASRVSDAGDALTAFAEVESAFNEELIRNRKGVGLISSDPEANPIFVIGMPRSGTTLVEHILASHSKVFGSGEVDYLSKSVLELGAGKFGGDGFFPALAQLAPARYAAAGTEFARRARELAPGQRIANKHLSHGFRVGLIHLMVPGAKIVHVARNAIDTCVSRYMSVFYPGNTYSYDLEQLGRFHRQHELLMRHWHSVLPRGVMLDVRYEDLVANPEDEIRKLLAHCGLEWERACLDFHLSKRSVSTPTRNAIRQPTYASSVGRWKRYREHLGPLLAALGLDDDGNPTLAASGVLYSAGLGPSLK